MGREMGALVLLGEEPYRLEGGGATCEFMLPLTVKGGRKDEMKMQDWTGQRRCWACRLVHEEEEKFGKSLRSQEACGFAASFGVTLEKDSIRLPL